MRIILIALCSALAASAQTLPPGKAKAIVTSKCVACHGLEVITAARANKARWRAVVEEMVTDGAKLSKSEIPLVIDYLAKNFPEPAQK